MTDVKVAELRFEWRQQTAQYAHGKDLRISGLTVGSAFYDGISSRAVTSRYKIETKLPGLPLRVDRFETEGEAMKELERFTVAWSDKICSAPLPDNQS